MHKTKVFIDPTSRLLYASYYIKGLQEVFGKKNVSFSSIHFKDLKRSSVDFSFEHYFAFVVQKTGEPIQKIVVDFCDPTDIHHIAYTWCDRYAKINFNIKETAKEYLDKIIPIPPGFGIRIWNPLETLFHCAKNYLKVRNRSIVGQKRFIRDYFQQLKRPEMQDYFSPSAEIITRKKPYIFMIASLWVDENARDTTNMQRKNFMETAKNLDCDFEGGFYARPEHAFYKTYGHLTFSKPYSAQIYLEKSKASYIVFNTPAVHACHGWKLGEYLAMGKAILSTPLSNDLSNPLNHGREIHFIAPQEDLKNTLNKLFLDVDYKNFLEKNAKTYFNKHSSPKAVINRILQVQTPIDFLVKTGW